MWAKMHRALRKPKTIAFLLTALLIVAAVAIPLIAAHAQATGGTNPNPEAENTESTIARFIGGIAQAYAQLIGRLLTLLIAVLVWVSGYSDFVNSAAVVNGWVIVRDIANMFFIIVLLIVAFGTILGQEQYHYKKLLPKLLLMAVLVNFSRTIVGVLIDAAQVIMLTFVNGYSAAAGGNFASIFQILEVLKYNKDNCVALTGTAGISDSEIMIGALLAAVLLTVSLITVFVILAVLVLRIIMLWLLTILSPLAFLAGTFPQGQKYYAQWWQDFQNQVIVGPLLAFFLWLSLATVGAGNAASQITSAVGGGAINDAEFPNASCTAAGGATTITSFIIGTMMLLAGVQMAQEMGGAIAGVASRAKGVAQRGLKLGAKYGLGGIGAAYAYGARKAKAGEVPLIGKYTRGIELNPVELYRTVRQGLAEKRQRTERKGRIFAGERMERGGLWGAVSGIGAPNWVENYAEGFMFNKGIKRILYGKRGDAEFFEGKSKEEEEIATALENTGWTDEQKKRFLGESSDTQGRNNALGTLAAGQTGDLKALPFIKTLLSNILKDLKMKQREEEDSAKKTQMQSEINSIQNSLNSNTLKLDPSMSFAPKLKKEIEDAMKKGSDRIKEIQVEVKKPTLTREQYAENQRKAAMHRKQAEGFREKAQRAAAWTPIDYEARAERRSLAADEMKKVNTSNEDELIALFQAAKERHDPLMAQAVAYQATAVGHLNELLNAFKSSKEYRNDKTGEIEAKAGQSFDASGVGLNAFMKDIFMKDLGFGKQATLSIQNDLSATAQGIHHWTYAQTVGASADGSFYQRGSDEQGLRNAVERSKMDYQELLRNGNRLSVMNEKWVDESDHDKGRVAEFTPYGITEIRRNFRGWKYPSTRNQLNPNLILNMMRPQNMEVLLRIKASLSPSEQKEFDSEFLEPIKKAAGTVTDKESKAISQSLRREIEQARKILQSKGTP